MSKLNTFQQWQVANGHHVTERIDGDEFHAPELCPLCSPDAPAIEVVRRTFEASKHPKGSPERARLNLDAVTSEYMPSYRYAVLVGGKYHTSTRTKSEAVLVAEQVDA